MPTALHHHRLPRPAFGGLPDRSSRPKATEHVRRVATYSRLCVSSSSDTGRRPPSRYAILGAGFAGLSVAWNLLKQSTKDSRICIDIYDENGIGGGASGVSGGLLHPYSPKAKLLLRGAECWNECLELLRNAEKAVKARASGEAAEKMSCSFDGTIVWKRGILRPAVTEKNVEILMENSQSCLGNCKIEPLDRAAAQCLIPGICVPYNFAVHMPLAMNLHPKRYLQALFFACLDLADQGSGSYYEEKEVNLFREHISNLQQLSDEYDAVIICLGAKVDELPEISGKLPLRMCRGVVAELELPNNIKEEYCSKRPSILSDAWLAFQGTRKVVMGSTWYWNTTNYEPSVSNEEVSGAMSELLPKAIAVYPPIEEWNFVAARAGVRAMPPLTPNGSLPLLGCLNDIVGVGSRCKYWLVGGLGSRGLLYHGIVGKLTAQAVLSSDEGALPPEFTSWKKIAVGT